MVEVIVVHDGFWRVRMGGSPVGCIQRFAASDGERFLARVIDARARRWTNVGEYWEFDAAVDALTMR
ncbi:hypothetical protein [Agromyces archimandritae]|uniref:Uncharacterized protein n=1 Tax=Agromyces archimandritae TaxID=2781962 RepID=A0A975FJG3_9MICO|nr:hypothetical protein [Agromyces archimandritae]QTX03648.1 hypothetical protein G127AT_09880 [Agromyces archimandritae]